ncbi:MAG TPA: NUDIX hydrolase [bacterium]|nr:NUDIX hydrolase [bacterium]
MSLDSPDGVVKAEISPFPRTVSNVILTLSSGSLIFGQRHPKSLHAPYLWTLLGGKVKSGENPYEAAVRELAVESGILYPDLSPWKSVLDTSGGLPWLCHLYQKEVSEDLLQIFRPNREIVALRAFSLQSLKETIKKGETAFGYAEMAVEFMVEMAGSDFALTA